MRSALRPYAAPLGLALATLAVHLICGNRYGFFRDELYFVACGQRLSWGYVDQPPLIAWVARFSWWLSGSGESVLLFRLAAYLAHAGSVLATAVLARRLSGGTLSMALAAALTFSAPLQFAQGHLLTMNVFELLLWSLVACAAVTAVAGEKRAWIWAGAFLGLALTAKYSAGLLAVALFAGLVVGGPRRQLASPWLWGGVALAAAITLPSLLWQAAHHFPFLELLENGRRYKNAPIDLATLAKNVLLEQGPFGLSAAAVGAIHLSFRRTGPDARFLGLALVVVLVAFAASGAKPYYLGPAFPPLFAAGAVWAEARLGRRKGVGALLAAVSVAAVAPGLPMALPLLEPEKTVAWMGRLGVQPTRLERNWQEDFPQHLADQWGWPERVAAVSRVVQELPAAEQSHAVIFTTNYGRAASLELLGRGLPPVASGHNQYFLWGIPGEPQVVVALGGNEAGYREDFEDVERAGVTPPVSWGMAYESEIPIYVLRRPREPVPELFKSAKHFE